MRAVFILIATLLLGVALATPAMAGMTKCLCNNGETIDTSRKGERGCNSACKILGGGGRVWTPEDESLEDDDGTVVRRRPRHKGPARHR